ncbi:hypothetical protein [Branchiibius sp. NY16-3462-2]|uniref:hypothetical protein n=1 Tax=Branchiibius sp. NY16-3462-2 TaxID=1807500 RepID=UPI0025BB0F1A|nr:hypothetical protein [Branchiibius sp. NY16-3462-2]
MGDLLAGLTVWWLQVFTLLVLGLGVLAMVALLVVLVVYRRKPAKAGSGSSSAGPLR